MSTRRTRAPQRVVSRKSAIHPIKAEAGLALYAGIGPELVHYKPDVASGTLVRKDSVLLPQNIHYAWPDPRGRFLYVGTSEGFPGVTGLHNHLQSLRIDAKTGALSPHGPLVELPARPIHLTLDRGGRHVVVAYNAPYATVHRIVADGSVGDAVPQPVDLDVGHYPHQVRIAPSGRNAIIVSRGHRAGKDRPGESGGLQVFRYVNGLLANRCVVAPNGGIGFGPRHLDFHPEKPWIYVSLELQNQLHMYRLDGDVPCAEPLFVRDTLARRKNVAPSQIVGPIRVHPSGRFVYTANRANGTTEFEGRRFFAGGENTLAVFAINQRTGAPVLIQHIDTRGLHCRTFAIDPSGRMLIAAHVNGAPVRSTSTRNGHIPACLSTFRIGRDGRLTYVTKYDVHTEDASRLWMYWAGLVSFGRQGKKVE